MGDSLTPVSLHGTFGYTVPLPSPAGRTLSPGLALTYASGAGNSPFGLGWSLNLTAIARRSDRRVPSYTDEDTFVFAGGDDLVPVGPAEPSAASWGGTGEATRAWAYRPRTESAYARIERHVTESSGETFWTVLSPDNVLTVYGRTAAARVADPVDGSRILQWLPEDVFDDRGDRMSYRWVAEDDRGIDATAAHEEQRKGRRATAQRYLKEVGYANRTAVGDRFRALRLETDAWRDYCFRLVFDFGDHSGAGAAAGMLPAVRPDRDWPERPDSFSSYRGGFEVRTRRLCRRVLAFCDFPELGPNPRLVQAVELGYDADAVAATMQRVTAVGYDDAGASEKLPHVAFGYRGWQPDARLQPLREVSAPGLPAGMRPPAQWVDLDGDGAPGLLVDSGDWFYAANLGGAELAPPRMVLERPRVAAASDPQVAGVFGDGRLALVASDGTTARYAVRDPQTLRWAGPQPFEAAPTALGDPAARSVDLDGDGLADLLVNLGDDVVWHRFLGERGWEPQRRVRTDPDGPRVLLADSESSIFLADLTGDGLDDVVKVTSCNVSYWPNLGHGAFGRRVVMSSPPRFEDRPPAFDARRVRFADVDGTGPSDVLYLGSDGVRCWRNRAGNSWAPPELLATLPVSDVVTSVSIVDLLGRGTRSLVVSSAAPGDAPLRYVDLMPRGKPYLLTSIDNGQGLRTDVEYATSTEYALRDRRAGRPWTTRLPVPVHVVAGVTVSDDTTGVNSSTSYRYRDGYYDGPDREFRGFGYVERIDTDTARSFLAGPGTNWFEQRTGFPPVVTVTEYATGSEDQHIAGRTLSDVLPEKLADGRRAPTREVRRALRGAVVRTATYALDGTSASRFPYSVSETGFEVRIVDAAPRDRHGHLVTTAVQNRTSTLHLERGPTEPALQYADPEYLATLGPPVPGTTEPPRRVDTFATRVNAFGQVEQSLAVAYGRTDAAALPEQRTSFATVSEADYRNLINLPGAHRLGIGVEIRTFEVVGLPGGVLEPAGAQACAEAQVVAYSAVAPGGLRRRKLSAARTFYWNDAVTAELPHGEVAPRALPRRSMVTALDGPQQRLFAAEIDAGTLQSEGWYVAGADSFGETVQWSPSTVAQYDAARFCLPTLVVEPFGLATSVTFDAPGLFPVAVLVSSSHPMPGNPGRLELDPAGPTWNRTTAMYDYRVLAVRTLTDPHGTVTSARYDALGSLVTNARRGPAGEGAPPGEDDVRHTYRRDSWRAGKGPAWVETEVRETDAPGSRRTRNRTYFSGAGAKLLVKSLVEPGEAPFSGPDGALVLAPDGRAALQPAAVRWLGTGRAIRDGNGRVIGHYDPYFAPDDRYEDESVLVRMGYPVFVRHDAAGRVVRRDFPDGSFDRVTPGVWSTTSEDRGDTVQVSAWAQARATATPGSDEALQLTQSSAYAATPSHTRTDALGRTVEVARVTRAWADGTDGPPRELVSRMQYDGAGRVTAVTDQRGVVMQRSTYDLVGRALVTVSADAGESRSLADVAGRSLRSWTGCGVWTDTTAAYAVRVRPVRDRFGRQVQTWVREDGAEVCRSLVGYGDEDAGKARPRFLLGVGHQVFDSAGLVETVEADFRGNVRRARRRFTRAFDHDPDWTPVASAPPSFDRSGAAAPLLESMAFETVTTCDALGRPTRTTGADGTVQTVDYGVGGLPEQVRVQPRDDAERTVLHAVSYDVLRRRASARIGSNGAVCAVDMTYDPHTQRLARLRAVRPGAGGAVLQDLTHLYDIVGNCVRVRDAARSDLFFRNTVVPADRGYTYDDLYRLRSAQGRELAGTGHTTAASDRRPDLRDLPDPAAPGDVQACVRYDEGYRFDDGDNLLGLIHRQLVPGGATWSRDMTPAAGSNRLAAVAVSAAATGSESVAHDSRGNLTQLGRLAFTTDWAGRTARTVASGNVTIHCRYDAAGRRVRKVVVKGSRVEERRYVGAAEFSTVTEVGTLHDAHETVRVDPGGGMVAFVERPTVVAGAPVSPKPLTRYQLSDALGSTAIELDGAGAPLTFEELHPYGTTAYESARPGAGVSRKRYRFTGKERDEETGLDYSGARYYVPWLGRWTAPDPAGLGDGTNAYCYVRGRPTAVIDPSGRSGEPAKLGFWEKTWIGVKEAAVQTYDRVDAMAALADPVRRPDVVIGMGTAVVERYEKLRAGPLPPTPAAAAVGALNDVLNPLAHAKASSDRAERMERAGDEAGAVREKIKEGFSLFDFALMVEGGAKAGPKTGPKAPPAAGEIFGLESQLKPMEKPAAPPPEATPAPKPASPPGSAPAGPPEAAPTAKPPEAGPNATSKPPLADPVAPKVAPPPEPTIWGQGNVIQGRGAETSMASKTPGTQFYGSFPNFDRAVYGAGGPGAPAVEIGQLKSIDTAKPTYVGNGLRSLIEKVAGELAGPGESTWDHNGHTVTIGPDTVRVLDVVIPDTPLTAAQEAAIAEAIEGSASMGVEVKIHRVH